MRDAILILAILVVACDKPDGNVGPPPDLRPLSVRIDGPTQMTLPDVVQFTALQTWSDGSTRDVTATAQWTSTNPSVLSVSAGLAKALAAGEVGLTAHVAGSSSQPKSVRVAPATPEWTGTYTLTIGGGACNTAMPLPPELRQRTYTAFIRQSSLTLFGEVPKVGNFGGQIFNPQVRFHLSGAGVLARRVQRLVSTQPLSTPTGSLTLAIARYEPRVYVAGFGSSAYPGLGGLSEPLADKSVLVITGEAITTMSPSGFAGTLNGALTLYHGHTVLGVCSSSSHGFTLVRK